MTLKINFGILAALICASAASASAQEENDSLKLRVDVTPSTPNISGVTSTANAAIFLTELNDGVAYIYDRRAHRFIRGTASRNNDLPHSDNARSQPDFRLADSLTLSERVINDELTTAVIIDGQARTIPLRGPRVAQEKQWRRTRGMPETPSPVDDDGHRRGMSVHDWAPVTALSYTVDTDAVWLGIEHNEAYQEFALGGLLRIDRKSRRVSIVSDSLVMHSSISQIEPAGAEYLLIADGGVLRFDPRSMRASNTGWSGDAVELRIAGDTVFIAERARITIANLSGGKPLHKGFRLAVERDSVVYELADTTIEPSRDSLAILGVADHLHIRKLNDWVKAARGKVRATAFEFYFPGDNISTRTPVEYLDSGEIDKEETVGPTAIIAEGVEHPALRHFLREALLEPSLAYSHIDIARILLVVKDTAAIPFLRVALKNWRDSYAAELAKTLALLGDTTGNRWIHSALLDTTRVSTTVDTADRIHPFTFEAAGEVRDPRNIDRLLELSVHPHYGYMATSALLEYRSADVAQKLLTRISRQDSMINLSRFMDVIGQDTIFPMTAALRDSVAAKALQLLYSTDQRWRMVALRALAQNARASDLPALIGALTLNQDLYGAAVVALVELTGVGVDAMPKGYGEPADRAAAQRWWLAWYSSHRNFKLLSKIETEAQVAAMRRKLEGY